MPRNPTKPKYVKVYLLKKTENRDHSDREEQRERASVSDRQTPMAATQNQSDLDFVTFTVIIDDIVHPDGRTVMESLGGGGTPPNSSSQKWQSITIFLFLSFFFLLK